MTDGILLIDKPKGFTSHDVINVVRKILNIKRVGHAGTLDPDATGLLVVCVGRATRYSEEYSAADKAYRVELQLGIETDTYDLSGQVLAQKEVQVSESDLRSAARHFLGEQDQTVPIYSAVKIKGRKLYEYARKGIPVDLPTRRIHVYSLDLISYQPPYGVFEMVVSKGTYVRSLAHDLGKKLGCGAATKEIRRIRCGILNVDQAIPLDGLKVNPEAKNVLLGKMNPVHL